MIITNTLQDIATLLLEHPVNTREHLLFEELERAVIYTSNCWDIINDDRPSDFYDEEMGEFLNTPEQLAWKILYDRFMNDYGILLEA
jgi:hypothetical protein